jgi:hypothetical protein
MTMTPTFADLCNHISYTAQPTFLARLRERLASFKVMQPVRDRSYHIVMRFQGRVLREPLTVRGATEKPTCEYVLGHWLEVAEAVNPAHEIDYNWWLIGQGLDTGPGAGNIYHQNLAFLRRLQRLLGAEYPTFSAARPD